MRAQRPGFELMRADKLGAISAKQMPDAEKRAKARFLVDTRRGFASADAGSAARFESADPGDLGLPNPVEPRTLSTFSTAGLREGAMPPSPIDATPRIRWIR